MVQRLFVLCTILSLSCAVQVPGNLIISARSASHSFDASQMNMSHVISHFSFGKTISPRVMSGMKQVLPYLGGSHDRLNGMRYISNPSDSNANVTVSFLSLICIVSPLSCAIRFYIILFQNASTLAIAIAITNPPPLFFSRSIKNEYTSVYLQFSFLATVQIETDVLKFCWSISRAPYLLLSFMLMNQFAYLSFLILPMIL